ncbi:aspartate--tRNA ligase dps1 [Mycoemilia scoparia]|uniref:Aspartate--tRNA ligase, cytoplasmic n=1 Tax=Mycoemilia scoparia TaxID=417184 RepID=A0A9W8A453_9FUNG|nr:aspartate--tRNA ligase dps1 [Mycoemilia scoparia]
MSSIEENKNTVAEQVEKVAEKLEDVILGEDGKPLSKKALKKLEKEREKERKKQERLAKEAAQREAELANDFAKDNYGDLSVDGTGKTIKSVGFGDSEWKRVKDLNESLDGQNVHIQVRVQTSRATGSSMCFLVLRGGTSTVQGLVVADDKNISKIMVKFIKSIPSESIVAIEGKVVKPSEPVQSCSVHDAEIHIQKIYVISRAGPIAFSLEDATRSNKEIEEGGFSKVNLDTRLDNRIIDLRTVTNNAIFRIQSAVCQLFREFLLEKKFTEIHSPKLNGSASEGGANVFEVTYFKRKAYLAQSPQLYKQMCIAADFGRVFEIGPVFRAEDSNTHRHMTEFVGLDLEMSFSEDYHEVMNLIYDCFIYIFKSLETRWAHELEVIRQQYPSEPIRFKEERVVLKFPEAIALLRESGVEIPDLEDLSTENEKLLGSLVAKKYGVDFYILDKFPSGIRPFYTMPDPADPKYSNSYDFFIRNEEIMSGAQRIHDADYLTSCIKEKGINPAELESYIDAFRYGCPPHAGGGVGLERVVMLYLGLGNIRRTSLFPRDPKRLSP